MNSKKPSITVVATRFTVLSSGFHELDIVNQMLIVWTLRDWCNEEMSRLIPLNRYKPDGNESA